MAADMAALAGVSIGGRDRIFLGGRCNEHVEYRCFRPQGEDRRTADERYTLRRLSSTRELCIGREAHEMKRAVIYGGLNYDMGTDAMARATSEYRDTDLAVSRTVSRGSLSLAEGMLPDENIYSETYHEAVNIAEMLRSCGVEPI